LIHHPDPGIGVKNEEKRKKVRVDWNSNTRSESNY
jgi:hypothetical protein